VEEIREGEGEPCMYIIKNRKTRRETRGSDCLVGTFTTENNDQRRRRRSRDVRRGVRMQKGESAPSTLPLLLSLLFFSGRASARPIVLNETACVCVCVCTQLR
jgi:hypothetical protein